VAGRALLVFGLLTGWFTSCHRPSAAPAPLAAASVDASSGTESAAAAADAEAAAGRRTESVFSAPIAATRVGGTTVVAGLVAARGSLRVVAWPEGGPAWDVDALDGVAWTPDAELRLEPAGEGVAVAWRGNVGGRPTHTVVVLGPRGEKRGEPFTVGGSFCATATGLAWVDAAPHGPAHVRARPWADPAPHEVATVPSDRAGSVLCGDHDVFLLGDGDDDLTSTTFAPGDPRAPPAVAVIRDSDFGDDDEREHHAYTSGDTLGLVRVSGSGAVALRDVSRTGTSPWRRLKHKIGPDDDVVATDGDAAATVIVFTHDIEDACDAASTAETIRALRADRSTAQDAIVDLARADCRRARGPFWLASPASGAVVAWVERTAGGSAASASIDMLAFGAVPNDPGRSGHLAVAADAVVQAGCGAGCWAAALVRPPDADGGQPEAIVLLPYP
jgi:hypothetical protein